MKVQTHSDRKRGKRGITVIVQGDKGTKSHGMTVHGAPEGQAGVDAVYNRLLFLLSHLGEAKGIVINIQEKTYIDETN